jgi:hypothetical protein
MRFTKKERDLDILSLEGFGLLPEEIEGYFDFYEKMWALEKPKKRKIMVINSRKEPANQ